MDGIAGTAGRSEIKIEARSMRVMLYAGEPIRETVVARALRHEHRTRD